MNHCPMTECFMSCGGSTIVNASRADVAVAVAVADGVAFPAVVAGTASPAREALAVGGVVPAGKIGPTILNESS